jgi:hypothetical protein
MRRIWSAGGRPCAAILGPSLVAVILAAAIPAEAPAVAAAAPAGTGAAPAGVSAAPAAEDPAASQARAMLEGHGGLETWKALSAIAYRDEFRFPHTAETRESKVTVDLGAWRAHLEFPQNGARIVWDGRRVWSLHWKSPVPARFLACYSLRFAFLPWLAAEPGTTLKPAGSGRLPDDPTDYVMLEMTLPPDGASASGETYVLYVHPRTHLLAGFTFELDRAGFPPGAEARLPREGMVIVEGYLPVKGLYLPNMYTIYNRDGVIVTGCKFAEWNLEARIDSTVFVPPEGAAVDAPKTPR